MVKLGLACLHVAVGQVTKLLAWLGLLPQGNCKCVVGVCVSRRGKGGRWGWGWKEEEEEEEEDGWAWPPLSLMEGRLRGLMR